MFDPFLFCSSFWLSIQKDESFVTLARRWSGQRYLETNDHNAIYWTDAPKIEIAGDRWCSGPPSFNIEAHHALIPMGTVDEAQAFVFVSPFASVSAAFKTTAYGYLHPGDETIRRLPDLRVDLSAFIHKSWKDYADRIQSIEGVTPNRKYVVVSALTPFSAETAPVRPEFDVRAISMEISGYLVKVYKDLSMELGNVEAELSEITSCIEKISGIFRPHMKTTAHAEDPLRM